jgi:hypothetical protein
VKIRKEQIAALNTGQAENFDRRMAAFLQEQFEEAAEEPVEELLPVIEAQTEKANRYGLTTEQDVASYVITAYLLGLDFDTEFPAAQEVLTAQVPAENKAVFLEEWTKEMLETLEGGGQP